MVNIRISTERGSLNFVMCWVIGMCATPTAERPFELSGSRTMPSKSGWANFKAFSTNTLVTSRCNDDFVDIGAVALESRPLHPAARAPRYK